MVCPGNPPRGHTSPATPDRAGFRDRLVCMATSAPGHGTSLTSQTKSATVVVGTRPLQRRPKDKRQGSLPVIERQKVTQEQVDGAYNLLNSLVGAAPKEAESLVDWVF